jgi:hypothetical protein
MKVKAAKEQDQHKIYGIKDNSSGFLTGGRNKGGQDTRGCIGEWRTQEAGCWRAGQWTAKGQDARGENTVGQDVDENTVHLSPGH